MLTVIPKKRGGHGSTTNEREGRSTTFRRHHPRFHQLGKLGFSGGRCCTDLRRDGDGALVTPGPVPVIPRSSPQDLARKWHGPFVPKHPGRKLCLGSLSLSRRQSATTAGALTDQARACLAVPPLASATLLDDVRQSKPRRRNRDGETLSKAMTSSFRTLGCKVIVV